MKRKAVYVPPMHSKELHAQIAKDMREETLQENVRKMAVACGWLYYHTHRSQHSPAGFPDCVMIKADRLLVAELKRESKDPTPQQQAWLDAFQRFDNYDTHAEHVIDVYVWRPSDWLSGEIERVLKG